ncbi:MAG: fatty acid desaturase family protein [Planctomycetaceae bacterium]|nr:fatty acid desaturase family protein [Planctomycetaceae bacterium]
MNHPQGNGDAPVASWSRPLPIETVRRLSSLSSWRSVAQIVLEWGMILTAATACWRVMQWNIYAAIPVYLLTILFIGSRQHALAILMHEGSHYRLFSNRTANDFFTELFTAWPMHIAMRNYREHHFPHHRAPNTSDDPDWELRTQDESWEFPKTRAGIAKMFLADFFGLRVVDQWRTFGRYTFPDKRKRDWIDYLREVYTVILVTCLIYFDLWLPYLVLWMVPMLTWLKVVLRVRTIAEHYALDYGHMYRQTRTTYPNFLERIFIAPNYINYHLDHHLYPSVPFYRLAELHTELLKSEEFRREAHLTHGYAQVLRECLAAPSTGSSAPQPAGGATAAG